MKTPASMLQIRNRRVVELAAKLAAARRTTKTDAVLSALENELARIEGEKSVAERLKPLQDRIAAVPSTGLEADKDFYDDPSGDPRLFSMRPRLSPFSLESPRATP